MRMRFPVITAHRKENDVSEDNSIYLDIILHLLLVWRWKTAFCMQSHSAQSTPMFSVFRLDNLVLVAYSHIAHCSGECSPAVPSPVSHCCPGAP